jgi:hypothetical protein
VIGFADAIEAIPVVDLPVKAEFNGWTILETFDEHAGDRARPTRQIAEGRLEIPLARWPEKPVGIRIDSVTVAELRLPRRAPPPKESV